MSEPLDRWKNDVAAYGVAHLRLRQVATLVKKIGPKKMVDLGCAAGQLRELCPGIEYLGCDFVAPSTPHDFRFLRCDFNHEALPAELQDVELFVCSGLLEYMEHVPEFLAQVQSRLGAKGYLVCTYFNMNHLSRVWKLLRNETIPAHPDWRGFHSPRSIARLIRKAGFQMKKKIPMNHVLRASPPVADTISTPLILPKFRPWSYLFAHQFLFVAQRRQP